MLYIIRHGRTDWNDLRKLQGQHDIPLNGEGRRMAEEARKVCGEVNFDICFCSSLIRARETAEILLKDRNVPILTDDRLKEMGFGSFEGLDRDREIPESPVGVFFRDPEKYTAPPGAESPEELFARTGAFLRERVEPLLKEGKSVLIVGHIVTNSSIICQVRHLPEKELWKVPIENCRLMRLL